MPKMHQNAFGVRLRPHPLGELMCCLDPVATIGGPTSMRREGRKPAGGAYVLPRPCSHNWGAYFYVDGGEKAYV